MYIYYMKSGKSSRTFNLITNILKNFSSVKVLYSDTGGVFLEEGQPYIAYFTPGILNEKQVNIRNVI